MQPKDDYTGTHPLLTKLKKDKESGDYFDRIQDKQLGELLHEDYKQNKDLIDEQDYFNELYKKQKIDESMSRFNFSDILENTPDLTNYGLPNGGHLNEKGQFNDIWDSNDERREMDKIKKRQQFKELMKRINR